MRPLTLRPISKPTLPTDTLVCELINDENQWNEGLIYSYFDKMDADRIVSISLPRRLMKDQLLWHYEKRGQCTVKSGYQITLRMKFPATPTCSSTTKDQWNIIWTLALPKNKCDKRSIHWSKWERLSEAESR